MPTFDIVSEYSEHEADNALDQANREVTTRFDFKNTGSRFEKDQHTIVMETQSEFQLQQMLDILYNKMTRRGIDIGCVEVGEPEASGKLMKQQLQLKAGMEPETSKKIVKFIKQQKMKVQAAVQGDKIRVTGKKRDDLQAVIALLREEKWGQPLQFENFRD